MVHSARRWQVWAINTVSQVKCCEICKKGLKTIGWATGFFYQHAEGSYLVTNKHVVIDEKNDFFPDQLLLRLHTSKANLLQNEDYMISLYNKDGSQVWLEHPNKNNKIDVVAIPLNYDEISKKFWTSAFSIERHLPPDAEVAIGEDLLVLGYPLGVHDTVNNLPIIRNATAASLYSRPFEENPCILIDARLHSGSSGSPVLTKPNTLRIINGEWVMQASPDPFLVGIYSGTIPKRDPEIDDHLGLGVVWLAHLIPEIIQNID